MFYIIFLNGIINDERLGCMVYLLDIAQDTPVFLVIVVAILFVFVAVYYFIYLPIKNASVVNNNQSKEDFEDIKYNIFEETKEVEDNLPVINEVLAPVEQSSDIVSDINKEDDFDIKNVTKEFEGILYRSGKRISLLRLERRQRRCKCSERQRIHYLFQYQKILRLAEAGHNPDARRSRKGHNRHRPASDNYISAVKRLRYTAYNRRYPSASSQG